MLMFPVHADLPSKHLTSYELITRYRGLITTLEPGRSAGRSADSSGKPSLLGLARKLFQNAATEPRGLMPIMTVMRVIATMRTDWGDTERITTGQAVALRGPADGRGSDGQRSQGKRETNADGADCRCVRAGELG